MVDAFCVSCWYLEYYLACEMTDHNVNHRRNPMQRISFLLKVKQEKIVVIKMMMD